MSEVNFGVSRYVVALNGEVDYTERDLVSRVVALQFERGGYGHIGGITAPTSGGDRLGAAV